MQVYFPYLFEEVSRDDLEHAVSGRLSPFYGSTVSKVDMTTATNQNTGRNFKRAVVHFTSFELDGCFEKEFYRYNQCEITDFAYLRQHVVRFIRYRKTSNSYVPPKEEVPPQPKPIKRQTAQPISSEWRDAVVDGGVSAKSPFNAETRPEVWGNIIYGLVSAYIQMSSLSFGPMTLEQFQAMAGKITGMILELSEEDFKRCVTDMDEFGNRFKEAVDIYKTL